MAFSINDHPIVWGSVLCLLLGAFAGWLVKSGIEQKKDNTHRREVCTERVRGVVSGYDESGSYGVDSDGDRYDNRQAFPIFKYVAGGQIYIRQSKRYDTHGKRRYNIGQSLTVFHAPGDPEKIYIPTEDDEENARLCIGFGGALLALCAFGAIRLVIMARDAI